MLTLDEILKKYDCDKSSDFHGYGKVYDSLFLPLRDRKISLLEIGVCRGNSLRAWEEYFTRASIHGVDILDRTKYDTKRVKTHIIDQKDDRKMTDLGKKFGPFNIIIDDGEHSSKSVVRSFNSLLPFLAPGGYYIVEDLHCIPQHRGTEPNEALDFFTKLIYDINLKGVIGGKGFRKSQWWVRKTDLRKGKGFIPSEIQSSIKTIQFSIGLIIMRKFDHV